MLLRLRADLDAPEIVPLIDGEPLVRLIDRFELGAGIHPAGDAYAGLIPAFYRFGPMDDHFHGRSTDAMGQATPLLGCECGEWGYWPLSASITVTEELVIWDEFEQPHRRSRDYHEFGPFQFGRQQYDAAVADLVSQLAAAGG